MATKSKRKHPIRHLVAGIVGEPWAISAAKASQINHFLNLRAAGFELSRADVREQFGEPDQPRPIIANGIAVLPLHGVIGPRMNMMMEMSGGTSTQVFAGWFREAMANQAVRAVVLDVDSPGGRVAGVEELADLIYASRGQKPIVAVADHTACSAAYWIATAAERFVACPAAELGSIGVVRMHCESSKADELAGVKYTMLAMPEHKAEANPYEPLSADARQHFESLVAAGYGKFVAAVARNRGVGVEVVKGDQFGRGRYYLADEAVARGMADRVATLEDVLRELSVFGSASDSN